MKTTDSMRLLLVTPVIDSYRIFFGELCSRLIAEGAQIHVACAMDAALEQKAILLDSDVHFHRLKFPRGMNPVAHLAAAHELGALVLELRPDIVDAHFSAAIFTTALARRRSWPVTIGTFHGLSFPLMDGLKGQLLRGAESWAASRFDSVSVLTADDQVRLKEAAPGASVNAPYSSGVGCDLKTFTLERVPAPERQSFRKRIGIKPEERVFIFVGRFAAFKGFDLTVRTFLKIAGTDPRLRLLLVGAPDPLHPSGLSPAEEIARKNCPQIIDIGWVDSVATYLAISDILVFPSRREGMSVCLMEALAMGVPVITRDSRGCRDVVRHGRDGLVLGDCTTDSLGMSMKRLAHDDDLRGRFSAEALAGRHRFDHRIFISEQIDLYHQKRFRKQCARLGGRPRLYSGIRRRLFDLALTVPALILLSPLMAAVALLVRLRLGAPVLFRQQRPGLGGAPFTIFKFRTMTDARDAKGDILPDEERMTRFGHLLRRSSLDELPELFNILKGDMSWVGPRPLLMRYLSRYTPEQMRRHEVLPGVTGLAQVSGRNGISWQEKLAFDVWYVDHRSLLLDLKVLAMTVHTVLSAKGVSEALHVSSSEFLGTTAAGGCDESALTGTIAGRSRK